MNRPPPDQDPYSNWGNQQNDPYAPPQHHQDHQQPYAPQQTNGMAIASMVLGIVGLPIGCIIVPQILAVIFGHISVNQCNQRPELGGKGMGIAGLVMGYIGLGIWVIYLLLVGSLAASGSYNF
ncbi:MAG: hypothetical protein ACI8UO_006818 [Verrucomicrobiales bacterium]|jgi:hypothetical protein